MWVRITYNGKTPVVRFIRDGALVPRMRAWAVCRNLNVIIDVI
jgi:hypothetical protein